MITLLKTLGEKVSKREMTWKDATEYYIMQTGEEISRAALKNRYYKLNKKLKEDPTYMSDVIAKESEVVAQMTFHKDIEEYYSDGSLYAKKLVNLPPEQKESPAEVLRAMNYPPENWELEKIRFTSWQQHTKSQLTKNLFSVEVRLFPRVKTMSKEEAMEVILDYFQGEIKPLKLPEVTQKYQNEDLMVECPGIELHLGKLAHYMDTGENYDHKIAEERFGKIMREIVSYQEVSNAANLTMFIGNDFFNSDTPDNTTTAGTQMQNDLRYKKMFLLGLKMYTEALYLLREKFSNIKIKLQSGNHDEATSFYLYVA